MAAPPPYKPAVPSQNGINASTAAMNGSTAAMNGSTAVATVATVAARNGRLAVLNSCSPCPRCQHTVHTRVRLASTLRTRVSAGRKLMVRASTQTVCISTPNDFAAKQRLT
eukprot:3292549-Rhodomonas_salina.1